MVKNEIKTANFFFKKWNFIWALNKILQQICSFFMNNVEQILKQIWDFKILIFCQT